MGKIDWSEDNVRSAVKKSVNYSECIRNLGHNTYKGNVETLKKYIQEYELDLSHFTFQPRPSRRSPGKPFKRIPLEQILVNGSTYQNNRYLKKRLLRRGLLEDVCSECNLPPEWNGKELVLQLDHINGVNNDNRLENLRLLCPNCHTQTDTFGRHGHGSYTPNTCDSCGAPCSKRATHCQGCHDPASTLPRNRKFDPSPEELEKLVWEMPATKVGNHFGVSGRAVKKRCRKYGIETPGRGYWTKKRANS